MTDRPEARFGDIAVELGFVSSDQLQRCLDIQRRTSGPPLIGQVMLQEGALTIGQLLEIIRRQQDGADDDPVRAMLGSVVMHLAPGTEVGRFRIVRLVGEGAAGVVFEAVDRDSGARVALKLLRGAGRGVEAVDRLAREVRIGSRLAHAGLVRVLESGRWDRLAYVVMDFVDGDPLHLVLDRGGNSVRDVVEWIRDLARALESVHAEGVVHRDIKPANILIDRNRRAHLTDFGLAVFEPDPGRRTTSGATIGTPPYMAPEQVAGHRARIGPWTDVYALGAVLYFGLTGRAPFDGRHPIEMYRKILEEDPPLPRTLTPHLDEELERIVLRAIEKQPANRFRAAGELADELDRYLDDLPIESGGTTMRRLGRSVWRRRMAIGAAVIGGIGLLVGSAAFLVPALRTWEADRETVAERDRAARAREARDAAELHLRNAMVAADAAAAREAFALAEAADPAFASIYVERAWFEERQGRSGHADADFARALALDEASPYAHWMRGRVRLGRYRAMRPPPVVGYGPSGVTVLPSPPADAEAQALLDGALKDMETAARLFESAGVERIVDRARLRYARGVRAFYEGDFAGAERLFEEAARDEPSAEHFFQLMLARFYGGRFEATVEASDAAARAAPADWHVPYIRGNARYAMAVSGRGEPDLDAAVNDLTAAIERGAGVAGRQIRAVVARAAAARANDPQPLLELSIEDHRALLGVAPQNDVTHNNLGNALRDYGVMLESRGDDGGEAYRESVEHLTRAIEINPRVALWRQNRGHSHLALGDYEPAIADFTSALDLGKPGAGLFAARGQARFLSAVGREDYARAADDLRDAIRLDEALRDALGAMLSAAERRAGQEDF